MTLPGRGSIRGDSPAARDTCARQALPSLSHWSSHTCQAQLMLKSVGLEAASSWLALMKNSSMLSLRLFGKGGQMGEETACVSCYRGSWGTCAPQDVHSSTRTRKRFPLLTLQYISPPSREELNLFLQSFLCTAIGIHKPFLLHYCFYRKFTASSNSVLKAICFMVFLLYKLTLSHNSVHSAEPALTSLLLLQGFLSRATWQHTAKDRFPEDLATNATWGEHFS